MIFLLHFWQPAPQRQRHDDHQYARHPVYGAPAAEACQQPGDGTRQQNPQQQAAHDGAHHLATFFRRGEGRGERHQDLRHHGEQPRQRGTDNHHRQRLAAGGDQHPAGGQKRHGDDQHPAFKHIAERHQEQQPGGIAELGGGDDKACGTGGEIERAGDGVEKRLRVIVAGDGQTRCHGH